MKIKQYRPSFCEGFENVEAEFETQQELESIPFVAAWAESPRFHRFSLSEDALMAEFNQGREWWVVARIWGRPPWLPAWAPIRDTVKA